MILKLLAYIYILFLFLLKCDAENPLENGFKRLFLESSNAYLQGRTFFFEFVQRYRFENYFIVEPQISTCKDVVIDSNLIFHQTEITSTGIRVHIPSELKSLNRFKNFNIDFQANSQTNNNYFPFPRLKHFSKNLSELTLEPYQRVMSFAIEVCLIPSIWYLELIHCMYVGMAPFFQGILMSYSLQEVVGTAVKTMDYSNETFSLDNCYNAVSLVADENISPYYKDICFKMKSCLEKNNFSEMFANLKKEFEKRIENVYSKIAFDEKSKLIDYAKNSLLTALSIKEISSEIEKNAPERNFLPIRAMIISLTQAFNISLPKDDYPIEKKFKRITKILKYLLYHNLDHFLIFCKNYSPKIYSKYHIDLRIFRELYCREILSIGFISEKINFGNYNSTKLNEAVMPARILDPAYIKFIPPMNLNSLILENNNWIEYVQKNKIEYITFEKSNDNKPILGTKNNRAFNKSRIFTRKMLTNRLKKITGKRTKKKFN